MYRMKEMRKLLTEGQPEIKIPDFGWLRKLKDEEQKLLAKNEG